VPLSQNSVLLPRMAAKIPVEPWKARPGMHASLCHKTQTKGT